jgi:hypothetical protein
VAFLQGQNTLAEIEIAPHCHPAQEVPEALFICQLYRIHNLFLQLQTSNIVFMVSPWQLCRPMAREATTLLLCPHPTPPPLNFDYIVEHPFLFVKFFLSHAKTKGCISHRSVVY